MLKVALLSRAFRNTEAVKDLSFKVRSGEVLGLLGPNGAGKTTTLLMLAGILRPDAGEVFFGDVALAHDVRECKRRLAFVSDEPGLFDELTCWEHIDFVARVYELPGALAKAAELLERLEMNDRRETFVRELSKGHRQRLALVLAFMRQPPFILLDEPMTALDPKAIKTVNELIREASQAGAAVILSSHLLPMLEAVCTNVLVIDKGRAVLEGNLDELKGQASLEEVFLLATKKVA